MYIIICIIVLLSLHSVSDAAVIGDPRRAQDHTFPQHTPNEILVKFREGILPQDVLYVTGIEFDKIERVHNIRPAVARFKRTFTLERAADGLYRFRGESYEDINRIPDEEIFGEIYESMSETEKSLYRSYKITLPQGASIDYAVSVLEQNSDVEYAEPNYVYTMQGSGMGVGAMDGSLDKQ